MQSCFLQTKHSVNARKGQTEFIVIIVLIAIGVGTVSYAAYKASPDSGGGIIKGTVEESVVGFISEAGYKTLETMSLYGGFLGPQDNFVQFEKQHGIPVVNYYYYDGEFVFPTDAELKANIVAGVTDYIRMYKGDLENALKSQGVVIDDTFTVDATIMPSKVILTLNMPTTVKNQSVKQPYRVELLTRFGEVYAASKSIVQTDAEHKFFEGFTDTKIALSSVKDGKLYLPSMISAVGCEPIHIGWIAMKDRMETTVEDIVSHTYAYKSPTGGNAYIFPVSDDGKYQDLPITFFTPTNFGLGETNFQFRTLPDNTVNVISAEPERSNYAPDVCTMQPKVVEYYVKYPVIVIIKDDVTKDSFRFALEVLYKTDYKQEALPIDFVSDEGAKVKSECESMKCIARVPVMDFSNNPIASASVRFGGCSLGETDVSGIFYGPAPCMTGKLEVSKEGYAPAWKSAGIDDIRDADPIILLGISTIKIYVYEVPVKKAADVYTIKAADVKSSTGEAFIAFADLLGIPVVEPTINGPTGEVSVASGTFYGMMAKLNNPATKEDYGEVAGFNTLITKDTKELHVYIPKLDGFGSLRGTELLNEVKRLTSLMAKKECGFPAPIMPMKASPKDCSFAAADLKPIGGGI